MDELPFLSNLYNSNFANRYPKAIVLSVFLRFTDSDYPFDIFKLFYGFYFVIFVLHDLS